MEKNVVSFVFKMTTKTQRGHYYMIKIYVMDTNVLIQSPNALFSFEDNLVVLPMVVLEELDHLKKADAMLEKYTKIADETFESVLGRLK